MVMVVLVSHRMTLKAACPSRDRRAAGWSVWALTGSYRRDRTRKADDELTAVILAFADCLDVPAVKLSQALRQGQPDPQAIYVANQRTIGAPE